MARGSRIQVDRIKSSQYAAVAENFFRGAELAQEFEYWNAAGLLVVHSAIAFTDAVTIRIGGVKSRGEDHLMAVALLQEIVALDEDGIKAATQLRRIIEEKNLIAYSGRIYQKGDVTRLWKHLERYVNWAKNILEE